MLLTNGDKVLYMLLHAIITMKGLNMHTINLSPQLYQKLEKLVKGFNDSPDKVIERLADLALDNKTVPSNNTVTRQDPIQEVEEIYPIAKEVFEATQRSSFEGRTKLKEALDILEQKMHRSSARMYIGAFVSMKNGELYKMAVNNMATRYFLEKIFITDGKDGLRVALDALGQHIAYRKEKNLNSRGITEIHLEFLETLNKKICPECNHIFQGNGWDGIDAHWRANHDNIMPYDRAWPLIEAGTYKSKI